MKKEIDIWNILHDGEITAVEKGKNGLYTIFVNIPYLRRRISPLGDSFVLTLSGVKQITFQDFGGTMSMLEDELEISTPEILQTESEAMPIYIATTAGTLILHYENIDLKLDTGQPVTFETIETVCRDYWGELRKRTKNNQR
ncbi:MAG: hypothetical protein FWG50_06615 [Kiritimatiellaeota bacterium]|nr:hypothetical protein [Kiritimatiellota bacterium]